MSDSYLEIKNVDFTIGGKIKVKNASFVIEKEGDTLCILGPSGIGKTTILRTIAGLEKIDKGSIKLNGKLLSSKDKNVEPEDRNISLAFQDNSLFPHYTVEKNILLGAERNKGKRKKKLSFKEIIDFLDIEKILPKYPHEISAGEAQRASLARSLVTQPDLLLLDEPTNDLDVETLHALEYALEKFSGSALIISHDRWFLDRMATHILAFEGNSHLEWFEGNYSDYLIDYKRRYGESAEIPSRIKYKKFSR